MGFMDRIMGNKPREVSSQPSEETPFNRTVSENLQDAPDYIKRQASKLYQMSREGPLSFRIFAFLGGILMVAAGIYGFVDSFVINSGASLLIAIYSICFGVGICILEGRVFSFPEKWTRTVKFYFRILDFTWGRGVCYAFVGSLQLTQPNWINSIVGGYMLLVGFVALIAAVGAGQKLIELRLAIDTRRDLKAFFNEYDVDKDGALNVKEFAILVSNLGVDVNYHELVACFNAMDKNDDELITYNEFNNWWTEWGKKNLQRSLSDVLV